MLERTMYLAITLLLVQYRFQITDVMVSIMQNLSTDGKLKLIDSKSYKCLCKVFRSHCCAGTSMNI